MRKTLIILSALVIGAPQFSGAQTSRPTSQPTSRPTSRPLLEPHDAEMSEFIDAVEDAHGMKDWEAQTAIEVDMRLEFGGRERLNGMMLFATDFSGVRIESGDNLMVWDGEKAWASPAESATPRTRFNLLTWSYFMAAPFKLDDPGAKLELTGTRELEGEEYDTALLTFGEGVGDAPDDWYVVYKDPGSGVLKGLAYIVTYGKSKEEAEKEPHAIVYDDFKETEAGVFPMTWYFYNWSEEQGVFGEPLGKMEIRSVEGVEPASDDFMKPEGAAEAPMPDA